MGKKNPLQDKLQKRRRRALLYAQGLRADGKPLRRPEMSHRTTVHPHGCVCHDCLFPEEVIEYQPRIRRCHV